MTGRNIPNKIRKSDPASGDVPDDVKARLPNKEELQKNLRPVRPGSLTD